MSQPAEAGSSQATVLDSYCEKAAEYIINYLGRNKVPYYTINVAQGQVLQITIFCNGCCSNSTDEDADCVCDDLDDWRQELVGNLQFKKLSLKNIYIVTEDGKPKIILL